VRVAISTDGKFVSQHFGRCPSFTIVDIEDGRVKSTTVLENPGHEPGAIPKFLHQKDVDCIVAGGMGTRAKGFFDEAGIRAILGVTGRTGDVIRELLSGTLEGDESLCKPGAGKGYGLDKGVCDHPHKRHDKCQN
jgi:predicted Fe-Mo cluster-binding NifX family protein